MTGFLSPNYTQTPNNLFDELMQDMTEAELKVVLAIVRKTMGYHKKSDEISLSLLEEMTGLSRQSCHDGACRAIERGIIKVLGHGTRGVTIYSLVVKEDQSTKKTSEGNDQSTDKTSTGQQSRHTKETGKKSKRKKEEPAPVPAVTYSEAAHELVKAWVNAAGKFLPLSYDANKCLAVAEEMLSWEPPVTVDDVRECTRFQVEQPRKADYRFDFLAKDLTGYRQRKQLQVVPPRPPVVSTLEAPIALTDDELAERRRLVEAARAERERMTA